MGSRMLGVAKRGRAEPARYRWCRPVTTGAFNKIGKAGTVSHG